MDDASREAKRLLVIDDDESLCEIFTMTMEKAGYQVADAGDGELGLAKAKVFKPHLIVLDMMMPKLNGFEVLRRLQSEGLGAIPVIVITGYSDPANAQIVRQEPNVVEFLQKPIRYADLPALIGRLLS
jgi:CheY-like chemotaxis protein